MSAWGSLGGLLCALLLGCESATKGNEGDCSAEISFQSVTYGSHNQLASLPSNTERIGRGHVLGCDGEFLRKVEVHAIDGVNPSIAIAVPSPFDLANIYVAEGVGPKQWPDEIRRGPQD